MKQLSASRRERSPLLGVTRDGDKGFEVIQIVRSPVPPFLGLIS